MPSNKLIDVNINQSWRFISFMKKLFIFLLLLMISPIFSCKKDSDSNESNPLALLALLGNKTLTVNVTYEGAYTLDGTRPGDGYIYVCLFNTLGPNTTSPAPVYTATNSITVTDTTVQPITVNGIWSGDYYIMVFFDYRASTEGDDPIQQNERYLLYNTTGGTNCTADATPVSIPDVESISITFDDTYRLDSGGGGGTGPLFDICP